MSLWSVIARRALGGIFTDEGSSSLNEEEMARLKDLALQAETGAEIEEALAALTPFEIKELARSVLRERAGEAIEILQRCEPCRTLLASGGYDPVELLQALRDNIGRRNAQMDIDESGRGGSQRGQGFDTRIRFGPREFLTGTSLDGMTLRESQLQVILHELAHAAGDVIPPDGDDWRESVRNQQRIARACLPETYERIGQQ